MLFLTLLVALLIIMFTLLGILGFSVRFTDAVRRDTSEEADYAIHAGLLSFSIAAALAWLLVAFSA